MVAGELDELEVRFTGLPTSCACKERRQNSALLDVAGARFGEESKSHHSQRMKLGPYRIGSPHFLSPPRMSTGALE
eukprot:1159895-Rhodomonas_salina.2